MTHASSGWRGTLGMLVAVPVLIASAGSARAEELPGTPPTSAEGSPAAQLPASAPPPPPVSPMAAESQVLPTEHSSVPASHARSRPIVSAQKLYRYFIRTRTPGRLFEVRTTSDAVVARCVQECWLELPRGDYRLQEFDAQGADLKDITFAVAGRGGIELEDPNPTLSTFGLVTGITGATLLPIGALLIMSAICINECADDGGRQTRGLLGLTAVATGAVLTPVGFVLFARNRSIRVDETAPTKIGVRLRPELAGGSLSIAGEF